MSIAQTRITQEASHTPSQGSCSTGNAINFTVRFEFWLRNQSGRKSKRRSVPSLERRGYSGSAEPVTSPWAAVILIIDDTHGALPLSIAVFSSFNSLDNYEVRWVGLLCRWGGKAQRGQETWPHPRSKTQSWRVSWVPTGPRALNPGPLSKLPLDAASRVSYLGFHSKWDHSPTLQKQREPKRTMMFFPFR